MNIGFGSHLPVLIEVVTKTNGPILELGGGANSTPYLHWACFNTKRKLVTYDNEEKYFDQIKAYEDDFHEVHLVKDWNKVDFGDYWSVAFVDHHPNLERKNSVRRLANICDYIIIHDTERKWRHKFQYEEIYPLFKYRYDYKKVLPHTTILTNRRKHGENLGKSIFEG